MKTILAGLLLAAAFTTGFTCSKNTPNEQGAQTQEAPQNQEQMAAPPTESAPTEVTPAAPEGTAPHGAEGSAEPEATPAGQ